MKKTVILFLLFLIVGSFFQCSTKQKPLAIYDHDVLTLKEFQTVLKSQAKLKSSYNEKISILSNVIKRRVILNEARAKGYYETPDIIKRTELTNIALLRQYYIDELTRQTEKIKFKNSDLIKFTSTIKMKYIWFNAPVTLDFNFRNQKEQKAKKVYSQILKNKNDFSYYADIYSEDPHNLKNGFVGDFFQEQIPQEWKSVVEKLKESEISKPIQTSTGYALLFVNKIQKIGKKKKWSLSQIFLKGISKTNQNKINRIYNELKERPFLFGKYANVYSEDENNKKGGDFPPFGYDRIYIPLAESAYKTGEGHISKIIENKFGLFILKVEKITKLDKTKLKTIKKNKKQLDLYKNRIVQLKKQAMNDMMMYKFKKRLYKKIKVVKDYSVFTNAHFSNENYIILKFIFNNKTLTYKDFLTIAQQYRRPLSSFDSYIDRVRFFEDYLVYPEALYIAAIKKGLAKNKNIKAKLKKITDDLVYNKFIKDLLNDYHILEKDLLKFYDNNRSKYKNKKFTTVRETVMFDYKKLHKNQILQQTMSQLFRTHHVKIYKESLLTRKEQKIHNFLQLGDQAFEKKDFKLALKYYQKVIKLDSSQLKAYISLYALYQENKETKSALDILSKMKKVKNANISQLFSYLDVPQYNIVVANLLGDFNDRTAIYPLMKHLSTTNKSFQSTIIRSLGNLHAIVASEQIFNILKQEKKHSTSLSTNYVVWYAIEALGKIGNEKINSYFLSWVKKEKNVNIKCFLIEALGNLGQKSSIAVLKKLLDDPVWGVRVLASQSLKKMTGKDYPIKNDVINSKQGKKSVKNKN